LSPVEQCREFHPLNAALDTETEEEAVEMSFDGALGHVEVTSDLGVIASLQQEIDDLLFPGPDLAEVLIHGLHLADVAPVAACGLGRAAVQPGPAPTSGLTALTALICMRAANPRSQR
jgi:hypothetical protein